MASFPQQPFPELSPQAEIVDKIRALDKGWLDSTAVGYPVELFPALQSAIYVEVSGTVIDKELNNAPLAANLNTAHLAALNSTRTPLLFVIESQGWRKRLLFGTDASRVDVLQGLLTGALGQQLVSVNPVSFTPSLTKVGCATVTGIPDTTWRHNQSRKRQDLHLPSIDDLLSTLNNANWLYVVICQPMARDLARDWLEQCSRESQTISEQYLNRDIQKANRLANHYLKLLERTIARLKTGFVEGLWGNGVYFLSPDKTETGLSLLLPIFGGERSEPEPVRGHVCVSHGMTPFCANLLTSREALCYLRLPEREYQGYRLQERIFFDQDLDEPELPALAVGAVISANSVSNRQARIPLNHLTRHGLVAGTTGSGKTNTLFSMLLDLWREHHVPFLVIEPAKAEYRNLSDLVGDLLVFTLGDETPGASSPFRLNPFQFPRGITLQTHIAHLTASFNASFVMYSPMPQVLEECLYEVYRDKGWNLVSSRNEKGTGRGAFPTLTDLHNKVDEVVNRLGYEERLTMDIRSALKTRLNNLRLGGKGLMLDTPESVPLEEILHRPTVLELKAMGNDDEKTFVMGLLLTAIYEYYEAGAVQGGDAHLRHLTLIEEAHRLLKNVPVEKTSEDQANMKGRAVEAFCNMLSEVRAYGEGMLVAEQIPTKLAPDILKNTGMKILHRLVAKEEREAIGHTMNLDAAQMRHVATLGQGEAIFFREGFDRPYLIAPPKAAVNTTGGKVKTADLCQRMLNGFFKLHLPLLQRYPACQSCGKNLTPSCVAAQAAVVDITGGQKDIHAVRLLLPPLLGGQAADHLRGLSPFRGPNAETENYCFSSLLTSCYLTEKLSYSGASFAETNQHLETLGTIHGCLGRLDFIGQTVAALLENNTPPFSACARHCRQICRFAYEGKLLCQVDALHNSMCDVLDSLQRSDHRPVQACKPALTAAIRRWFRTDFRFAEDLGLCFVIHKLHEMTNSESRHEAFWENYTRSQAPSFSTAGELR